ncbi:MAG TPA: PadR family transcriptional regulator [Candidatus Saccharimonadales bacterium]|nr:PadR family transcriptional regulator [Candidatus Saccharimonadales bacterium]
MTNTLTKYENQLLAGWEEIYKRGQLTLWILIALLDGQKHMVAIKGYLKSHTSNMLTADDQSMYRALRRYAEADLVAFKVEQNSSGPDKKIYRLTPTGEHVLRQFVTRNVAALVNEPVIQRIIGEDHE